MESVSVLRSRCFSKGSYVKQSRHPRSETPFWVGSIIGWRTCPISPGVGRTSKTFPIGTTCQKPSSIGTPHLSLGGRICRRYIRLRILL